MNLFSSDDQQLVPEQYLRADVLETVASEKHPCGDPGKTSSPNTPPQGSVNDTHMPQSSTQEYLLDCTSLAGASSDLVKKLWDSIDTLAALKRALGGTEQDTGTSDREAQGVTYGYQALRSDAVEGLAPLTPEAA
jgi:hypothetical protein